MAATPEAATPPKTGCVCKQPGFCKRHNVEKPPGWWERCRNSEAYFRAWEEGRGPGQNIPELEEEQSEYRGFIGGPGTELSRMLSWFGINHRPGCPCPERAAKMDEWGCDNCEYRMEEILDWLGEEAEARGLPYSRFIAKRIVRLAIRKARKKEHQFNIAFAAATKGFDIQGERVPRWEYNQRMSVCTSCQYHYGFGCKLIANNDVDTFNQLVNRPEGLCPRRKWEPPRVKWITYADLLAGALRIAERLPSDIGYVVALPRSGLIPATAIACHLHLPVYSVVDNQIISVGLGTRSNELIERKGRGVIVDDTFASGMTLQRRIKKIPELGEMLVAAVYVLPGSERLVHYWDGVLPIPHLLEWNFFTCPYFQHIATDLDGIICHNPPLQQYSHYVPRNVPVAAIITSRPESERQETEEFLKSIGCKWKWLTMWPGTAEERTLEDIVAWKVDQFWKSFAEFYVESEPIVADGMRKYGVRVLCPVQGGLW